MSWWNSSGWTDIANKAFKNAQEKIDKVLDIKETDESDTQDVPQAKPKPESKATKEEAGSEFWNSWLSSTSGAKPDDTTKVKRKVSEKKEVLETKNRSDKHETQTTVKLTPDKQTEKQSLSRKSSDERIKTKLGKTKSSPRSPKQSDSKTKSQEKVAGWEFDWDGTQGNRDDTWSSFNFSGNNTSVTPVDNSTDENINETELNRVEKDRERKVEVMAVDETPGEILVPVIKSDSDEPPVLPISDNFQMTVSRDFNLDNISQISETIPDKVTDTELSSMSEKLDFVPSVLESNSLLSVSVIYEENFELHEPLEREVCASIDDENSPQVNNDVIQSESLCEIKPDNSTLTAVSSDSTIVMSDSNLDLQQTDCFNISDVSILTISGSDYPQSILTEFESEHSDSVHSEIDISVQYNEPTYVSQSIDVQTTSSEHDERHVEILNVDNIVDDVDTDSEDVSKLVQSYETSEERNEDNTLEQSYESLGGSFVKCMIEEAMEDMPKPDDTGSDNHSNGEKSESSKVESEIDKSVSGHDSSDEIETTTSSDIEILSAPTPNGEYKLMDLSPLKLALQKTSQRGSTSHRRNDSSSSSTYSKAGESDQMSPGRDSIDRQDLDLGDDFEEHHRRTLHEDHRQREGELSVVSEESSNPYQTETLLKTAPKQDMEFVKKLAGMAEVLQARENKLVQLSKENNDLLETNSILRNQLEQSEASHETEMEDVEAISEEFKQRITEGERKFSAAIRERDNLKKQLISVQSELHKKNADKSQQILIEEKDEQIKELLEEGEKLSKQQLQSNNIIKKLRVKEKENESLITSQKAKIEEMSKELEHLRKFCDSKAELEKKQTDAINQLNSAVQKQEKELMKYKGEEDDFQEKTRSLQAALDSSYKEIAELHKANAAQDCKANEMAQSVEIQMREEAQFAINKELIKARQEKEALIMQIEDLRISIARMEKEHNRKEDFLRQEISDLQFQLQADEQRNQELTQNVSSTTRPLLRQIESLQAAYKGQTTSFEKVEQNLTDRMTDIQTQLAVAVDKERTASEKLMEISSQITFLETQNSRLKQEKAQLTVQCGLDKNKIQLLEDAKQNETVHIEVIKTEMSKEISDLKRDKVFLESQIELEKNKVESEKRRCGVIEEQMKILERERPKSRGTPSPISISRQESISSFTDQPPTFSSLLPQEDILERSLYSIPPNNNRTLYEHLRHTGATALIEGLESQLKLREGEITQLQSEISQLERTRESMAKELVNLTNQNEELEEQLKNYPELVQNYKDLDGRYNAILQMYGEKVEETEELKLDLEDVKDMYKQQINHLLTK